jgi:hypothetical protein
MHIDFAELRKWLPTNGGHLSLEVRDAHRRLVATASLDLVPSRDPAEQTAGTSSKGGSGEAAGPPGPNFLSIIS